VILSLYDDTKLCFKIFKIPQVLKRKVFGH
jgi:hypothetical protein